MYTTYDKINDRFGFHAGGTFRCAFKNTRLIVVAGITVISIIALSIIINLIYIVSMFDSAGSIGDFLDIGRLFDVARYSDITSETLKDESITEEKLNETENEFLSKLPKDAIERYNEKKRELEEDSAGDNSYDPDKKHLLLEAFSTEMINMSVTFIATAFGLYALFFSLVAFAIIIAILRAGQGYKFKADDKAFTVIYPKSKGSTLTVEYEYITGLTSEEWHMPFAPKCLDITLHTKQGEFAFRCIHTPMSRANGICELPFNIIKEKIGVSNEADVYLVHKTEEKFSNVR